MSGPIRTMRAISDDEYKRLTTALAECQRERDVAKECLLQMQPVAFQFGPHLQYIANHWPPRDPGNTPISPLYRRPAPQPHGEGDTE